MFFFFLIKNKVLCLHFTDPQISVCKKLVFSGSSSAQQLQNFIESNIYHRQGQKKCFHI